MVHVITKVWYTYLGYERTKISVAESLEQLVSSSDGEQLKNIRVHVLIHWPRCIERMDFMNCEQEEENLPAFVKETSDPVPHLNKDTAFLESWRALEDIFLGIAHLGDGLPRIESIGVSNFYIDDMRALLKVARVVPHILQGNVWDFVFDNELMNLCHEHFIHYQAYNVMNGIIGEQARERSSRAYDMLVQIAHEISEADHRNDQEYTPGQVFLKLLVQNDVSVIPRTTQLLHLQENSPYSIARMPHLLKSEEEKIIIAVQALLKEEDLGQPHATFVNSNESKNMVHLYWKGDNEEVLVKENLLPGEEFNTDTFLGHTFVAYDENRAKVDEFKITADWGQTNNFHLIADWEQNNSFRQEL